jgi:tRNA(Ile)-lysidine synthase
METVWRLTRHVETQIRACWPDGPERLVAAVSGGADSMCLLHLLVRLRAHMGFRISAVHVHHGIRGESADQDALFVEQRCTCLDVPVRVVRVDAPGFALSEGLGLEDAARRLRHQAFREVRRLDGADAVALAHHRDDQAETVLMNLLRGAASDGLGGMHVFRDGCFRPFWTFREPSCGHACMKTVGRSGKTEPIWMSLIGAMP